MEGGRPPRKVRLMSTFSNTTRRASVVLLQNLLWAGGFVAAFLLRFDFAIPSHYLDLNYFVWVIPLLVLRTVSFAHLGLFSGMWRYTGTHDLEGLIKGTAVSTGLFAMLLMLAGVRGFPRSIVALEFLLAVVSVGGLRFSVRAMARLFEPSEGDADSSATRILIAGAGDTGEMLLREINRKLGQRFEAVGFVDDNPGKQGATIHGVKVMGHIEDIARVVAATKVDQVVVAIPSLRGRDMRRIVDLSASVDVPVRTLPGYEYLIDGRVTVNQIRNVQIEDLLGRDAVRLDQASLAAMIGGNTVMVTGAGGSIGSELCRQIARFKPAKLVLLEQAENSLYQIHREMTRQYPDIQTQPCIADIVDRVRLGEIMSRHQPTLILHAAAHKHVPMMEWNPAEAVKNNVGGTRALADAAHEAGVERFVMISTDKAVNPTSVMGCTKRVAELYVQSQAARSKTKFVTVRFGNVLGSAGSVIPLFKEQIARGGPVTVTHPEMQRYFMTIPEASQLVLEACSMGTSGEIFILDMGEPVRIVKLAEDLVTLSGLKPYDDIEIAFTGVRPGEKLFEELAVNSENATKTKHPKIFVGNSRPVLWENIHGQIDDILMDVDACTAPEVRNRLLGIVPEYTFKPEPPAPSPQDDKVIPIRRA